MTTHKHNISISIIIPVYNEVSRLKETTPLLFEYLKKENSPLREVIFVNDGSTDGTLSYLQEIQKTNPIISILSYDKNKGKGAAIYEGFLAARHDFVLFSDADLSTPLEMLSLFLPHTKNFDIIIASRKKKNSQILSPQPLKRKVVSTLGMYVRKMFLLRNIDDTQCGFKLFNKKAIKIITDRATIKGYAFDIEALVIAKEHNLAIKEVEVTWKHNDLGNFSLFRSAIKIFRDLIKIWLLKIFGFYKAKQK